MAIQIEALEAQLRELRAKGGGMVSATQDVPKVPQLQISKIPDEQKPIIRKAPRIELTRTVDAGKTEILTAVPVDGRRENGDFMSQQLRVEHRSVACCSQCRLVRFPLPVRVEDCGVYRLVRGKKPSSKPDWQPFNLWSLFSGRPEDRKKIRALGVSSLAVKKI